MENRWFVFIYQLGLGRSPWRSWRAVCVRDQRLLSMSRVVLVYASEMNGCYGVKINY